MKPEAQRIAIAEWCGWKIERGSDGEFGLINPNGLLVSSNFNPSTTMESFFYLLPHYTTDLNAMHSAESTLNEMELGFFCRALSKVCCHIDCQGHLCGFTIHSKASQRAEALLKTIGKWRDE